MYRNLEAELAYKGISKKRMADDIGINYNTLLSKMSGKSQFTLDEGVAIAKYLQADVSIEELFKNN